MYTANSARNAYYAFGLVCGLGSITGGFALATNVIIDECLAPSRQEILPKEKEGQSGTRSVFVISGPSRA